MTTDFYKKFEEKFRGNREVIKTRLRCYLPFITPLKNLYPEANITDLGCGRGEWLELLMENGFSARGVDFDEVMVQSCKEKNLPAECADAIQYLQKLPAQSQIVVSAFHIVEHIPFEILHVLVQEALRVLHPAGILIMETPNPENIHVAGYTFYLDPTHNRPIPPELLAFLPEYYGFEKVKILRLQESPDVANKKLILLDVIKGVSPDYAVVAQKKTERNAIADNVFNLDYGVSLEFLAKTYNKQLDERADLTEQKAKEIAAKTERTDMRVTELKFTTDRIEVRAKEIQSITERFEKRIREAEYIAERAEVRAKEAEEKIYLAEARSQEAEFKAKEMEYKMDYLISLTSSLDMAKNRNSELDALLQQRDNEIKDFQHKFAEVHAHVDWLHNEIHEYKWKAEIIEHRALDAENKLQQLQKSPSWRFTEPFRRIAHLGKDIGKKTSQLPNMMDGFVKKMLAHGILYVKNRPKIRRFLVRIMNRFPGVKARSVEVVAAARYETSFDVKKIDNFDLTDCLNHRAKKFYCELKVATENFKKDLGKCE